MSVSRSAAPVLVLSQDQALRQSLSRDLARVGFETIPVVSGSEARRYFQALGPQLVVAPFSEIGNSTGFIDQLVSDPPGETTLAIVGDGPEQGHLFPRSVVFVSGRDLSPAQLTEKILLLLLGKSLELPTDHSVECLVGSLEQRPFLELIRELVETDQTVHVHLSGTGDCWTHAGEVIAAQTVGAFGAKAFARLARRQEGSFQVRRIDHPVQANVQIPWDELMTQAINESLISLPDPESRLELRLRDGFFNREYSGLEQKILRLAQQGGTVRDALDLPTATDGVIIERLQALDGSGVLSLEAPHRPLRILTDSTADLPISIIERLGIKSVPLTVHFGKKVFRDRVDIQPRSFYELLAADPNHPRTNPPGEGQFQQIFSELSRESDVLAIHLSKRMSRTADIAQSVAEALAEGSETESLNPVRIVDSQQVSLGLGLLTWIAARLATEGRDLQGLGDQVEEISGRIKTLFAVDTLTYLERGGRINKARAWIGSLLKVKPILGLEAGEVVPIDRARGGRAAYPRLVELLAERVDPTKKIIVMVAHANAPQWADHLRALIEERFDCDEVQMAEIGPVVGTHTGPGTVGVTAFQPSDEELAALSGSR